MYSNKSTEKKPMFKEKQKLNPVETKEDFGRNDPYV